MATVISKDSSLTKSYKQVDDRIYERILFKTHFIQPGEDMVELVASYTQGSLCAEDIIFISDKALANSQQRIIRVEDVKPGFFARFLYKFVTKSDRGRGIGTPQKMQVSIEQVGLFRILFAAFCSFVTKILGLKGVFYRIVGEKVRGIDGMSGGQGAPYQNYIILPSENPSEVATRIFKKTGCQAIIADINDFDGYIMGWSSDKLKELNIRKILRDNPMGQGNAQTPIGLIRFVKDA